MNLKTRQKLAKLVAMLGSSNSGERDNAQRRIDEILTKHKRSWSELPEILRSTAPDPQPPPPPDVDPDGENTLGPLDLLTYILKQYVEMREYEYLAVALWIMHSHVFGQFMVSPRLAVVSPARGCGKTILVSILNVVCAQPEKTDGITPASIFAL